MAGCWNGGCDAEPRLAGGAVEWVRRAEGLRSRGEAWAFLLRGYPWLGPVRDAEPEPEPFEDFCRLPAAATWSWGGGSVVDLEALAFVRRQWGLDVDDARRWNLGVCARGRYAWRVVVPIAMGGAVVSFQARTFRSAEPKYLLARSGGADDPAAECGRPASAVLFNSDAIAPGRDVVLVEGAGDAMAWSRRSDVPAAALCGQALTPEKLALIRSRAPRRVVVALDAGAAERRRADDHVADLAAWGLDAVLGAWVGAKDAGAGAELRVADASFPSRLRARLGS